MSNLRMRFKFFGFGKITKNRIELKIKAEKTSPELLFTVILDLKSRDYVIKITKSLKYLDKQDIEELLYSARKFSQINELGKSIFLNVYDQHGINYYNEIVLEEIFDFLNKIYSNDITLFEAIEETDKYFDVTEDNEIIYTN